MAGAREWWRSRRSTRRPTFLSRTSWSAASCRHSISCCRTSGRPKSSPEIADSSVRPGGLGQPWLETVLPGTPGVIQGQQHGSNEGFSDALHPHQRRLVRTGGSIRVHTVLVESAEEERNDEETQIPDAPTERAARHGSFESPGANEVEVQ